MSRFKILNEVLKLEIIKPIEHNKTIIKENDRNATLNEVVVRNIPTPSFHISPDLAQTNCVFAKGKGQLSRCDALIFTENKIFFIELKSTKDENKYYKQCVDKFMGVDCLIDYIDSVVKKFYNSDLQLSSLEKRYIMLYQKLPFNKTNIRHQNKKLQNTSPESMLKLAISNGEEISITKLFD